MDARLINEELIALAKCVSAGDFFHCLPRAKRVLESIDRLDESELRNVFLLNVAAVLTDLGAMQPNRTASEEGLRVYEEHKYEIVSVVGEAEYYYNLGNAKCGLLESIGPSKIGFNSIESLIEAKSILWRSVKLHRENGRQVAPQVLVNLANLLKRQFRISEALSFYDRVIQLGLDIPQAWLNRSEALMLLNYVSGSYSIKMLREVKKGYEQALVSQEIPPPWRSHYQQQVEFHEGKIRDACYELDEESDPELDAHETALEFEDFNGIRQFILTNHLSLSEHGLYCNCVGSSRDDLTIPTASGVYGDFVPAMEMVLNRLKSEFSLARRFYYEYQYAKVDDVSDYESCYSELFNGELLGVDVEKLRTAFRVCFGILDKIAAAVCDLYKVHPESGMVYFQGFWQLDRNNRRAIFEKIKTPGLLALYSLATDLNEQKDGELAFYKKWRNDLEHKFLVIYDPEQAGDVYESYKVVGDVIKISEPEFVDNLQQLLQLTRSAIFSFVFCVREKGANEENKDAIYFPRIIGRKDYFGGRS